MNSGGARFCVVAFRLVAKGVKWLRLEGLIKSHPSEEPVLTDYAALANKHLR